MLRNVLENDGKIDIIVGIPSFNEADNIDFVAEQVDKGRQKYYPDKSAVIINCDGGSTDDTRKVFLGSKTKTEKKFIQTPKGVTGKGNSFKLLFKTVNTLKADAVMVVDADLRSVNEDWVKYLLEPIFEGFDYITPVYARHKYDGTITNMICYPILYGLVGLNVRQPIGGDFSFSGRLAEYWLKQQWYPTTGMYGIDIFMTTHAVFGGFNIAQAGLGAKIHKPSAPKLSDMFIQVVSTLFENLLDNKEKWKDCKKVKDTKLFGLQKMAPAQDLEVDKNKILKTALAEYDSDLASKYLSEKSHGAVNHMFDSKQLNIDAELWSKCVYDILRNFNKNKME